MKRTHTTHERANVDEPTAAMLACELHDGPCQTLTAAFYHLEAFRRLERTSPEKAVKALDDGIMKLHQGIQELRNLLRGLSPAHIDSQSLPDAIHDLTRQQARANGLRVSLVCMPTNLDVPTAVKAAVLRIVEEALRNVHRHSRSKVARVAIRKKPDSLQIEIEDWGHGFNTAAIGSDCFGIASMQARAAALGGHVCVTSQPGEGTLVLAHLPVLQTESLEQSREAGNPTPKLDIADAEIQSGGNQDQERE
jgi:signal transduction histidine kinase